MPQQYDVGVIGYGACGAVLVNLLLERGLSVIVFDKEAGVLEIPRAAHFDDETVRTFQAVGAADDLSEGFATSRDYGIYNALDQRVMGFAKINPEPTDQGWLSDYFFFQPAFEHYLRDKALKSGVTEKIHCETVNLKETVDGVEISYKDASGADAQQALARYVVGADGARSFVRKYLGGKMEQLAKSQRWMIVDIRIHEGVEIDLSSEAWTKVTPEETITFVPMPGNMQRFEFSMDEGLEESAVKSPESVAAFIAKWFRPGDYDILRADVYHFHSLVATGWRKGRVLLAGDAAHLMPPFLGQGVCSAIRDALNLAWKLARVIKGESTEELLDTYESERRPHVYTYVKIAGGVGDRLQWMAKATPEELASMDREDYKHMQVRPLLGPGLHSATAKAGGALAPQPRLADGTLLDYKLGYNFGLVGDPELISNLPDKTVAILKALGTVFVPDDSDTVRDALARIGGAVMLIRPDRYLVGLAGSVTEIEDMAADLTVSMNCTEPT